MSYTKQTWANGDIITAAKLNHIEDGIEAVETELTDDYARTDGAYEEMTVGNAEQLISSVTENDKVPYNFRTSGGSIDIGDREVDKIVGGTIAWNQLIQNGNFADDAHWFGNGAAFTVSGGAASVTPTQKWGKMQEDANSGRNVTAGHRYLAIAEVIGDTHTYIEFGAVIAKYLSHESSSWQQIAAIGTASAAGYARFGIGTNAEDNFATISVRNAQIHDLTQMFGSAIADYIYSLEQATAGAGVAWFKKLFPKPYYAYDSGSLQSVKTSAHKTVGFNAYDHSTGKAKVVGGNVYQITGTYTSLSIDGETITPDGSGYFTPSTNGEVTVVGGNATDTCIHLKWDGERDGEYEAYVQHTYPLDPDLELRGIPKLDANNSLYYDGDEYASDGSVTRKFKKITLNGSQTIWASQNNRFYVSIADTAIVNAGNQLTLASVLCGIFAPTTWGGLATASGNMCCAPVWGNGIAFRNDNFTTAAEWTTFFTNNPTEFLYMVKEPFEESADPYQNPQIVDDFGTEEYVDAAVAANTRDVAVPVGHDTNYQANLRAKLEMAPVSPDSNGDYIVRHNNGENSYVPITFPADELPAAPTEDGNYVLKCTVADGAATFTWASAT